MYPYNAKFRKKVIFTNRTIQDLCTVLYITLHDVIHSSKIISILPGPQVIFEFEYDLEFHSIIKNSFSF
jgi:hypothetical protein